MKTKLFSKANKLLHNSKMRFQKFLNRKSFPDGIGWLNGMHPLVNYVGLLNIILCQYAETHQTVAVMKVPVLVFLVLVEKNHKILYLN